MSAYRAGRYGGAQAALVRRSGGIPGHAQGSRACSPAPERFRRAGRIRSLFHAGIRPECTYPLRPDAENGYQRCVPLVVRSPSGAGRTVLMLASATWPAHNRWAVSERCRGLRRRPPPGRRSRRPGTTSTALTPPRE
ncbi:N,N-dimethylformamidase beta subunit family domain-containing protein [Streptomyces sp. NPDC051320]|uniref:N,N-dimethylformamidase beta subunit family domain-containing protein n=1 Tax=Streptomyces sp. NPDC051320 TaxID=3154644 RepID=UPI003441F247